MNLERVIRMRVEAKNRELLDRLAHAEAETMRKGLEIARNLSSGPYSSVQLRRMGHPYAIRDPRPPLPPENINVQDADAGLKTKWKGEQSMWVAGVLTTRITNSSPVIRYLVAGTRWSIPRPIGEAILKLLLPIRRENIRKAVKDATR